MNTRLMGAQALARQQWLACCARCTVLMAAKKNEQCPADGEYLARRRGAVAAGKGLPLQVLQLLRLACVACPNTHRGPGLQSCMALSSMADIARP